jgi:hypothetical protein
LLLLLSSSVSSNFQKNKQTQLNNKNYILDDMLGLL